MTSTKRILRLLAFAGANVLAATPAIFYTFNFVGKDKFSTVPVEAGTNLMRLTPFVLGLGSTAVSLLILFIQQRIWWGKSRGGRVWVAGETAVIAVVASYCLWSLYLYLFIHNYLNYDNFWQIAFELWWLFVPLLLVNSIGNYHWFSYMPKVNIPYLKNHQLKWDLTHWRNSLMQKEKYFPLKFLLRLILNTAAATPIIIYTGASFYDADVLFDISTGTALEFTIATVLLVGLLHTFVRPIAHRIPPKMETGAIWFIVFISVLASIMTWVLVSYLNWAFAGLYTVVADDWSRYLREGLAIFWIPLTIMTILTSYPWKSLNQRKPDEYYIGEDHYLEKS